jgi:histidinol-phosphatase
MAVIDLPRALDTATRAVRAASEASLRHFRPDVEIEIKPDRTPVTKADKEAEAAIIGIIREAFPGHALLTEESGALAGSAETRWIVDPLDGTRGFTRGGKFWGPLVALEHHGEIVAGAMAMPAMGQTYWAARGMGAFRDDTKLQLSSVSSWADATLSLGEITRMFALPNAPGIEKLIRTCASARAFGDIAACAMLLNGHADAWVEGSVRVWDIAPMQILIEEAGGKFSDYEGQPSPESGNCIGTNGLLHSHVLAQIRVTK